jgi:hypothetical protein
VLIKTKLSSAGLLSTASSNSKCNSVNLLCLHGLSVSLRNPTGWSALADSSVTHNSLAAGRADLGARHGTVERIFSLQESPRYVPLADRGLHAVLARDAAGGDEDGIRSFSQRVAAST